MTRVLVCGGRDFEDLPLLDRKLDELHSARTFSHVLMGDATGADFMAMCWAGSHELPFTRYVAKWDDYGRSAGPRRNRTMLEHGKPDVVVAFPGGNGTADMVRRAKAAGVEVIEVA